MQEVAAWGVIQPRRKVPLAKFAAKLRASYVRLLRNRGYGVEAVGCARNAYLGSSEQQKDVGKYENI